MKHTLLALLLTVAAASAQSGRPLPPDIDARSYSRLPLIPKDSLGVEGRRVFEAVNGKDASVPGWVHRPAPCTPLPRPNPTTG